MRTTSNPAFWRALHSLAHPVSLAAMVLLLFNDHWLRWHYPSWLTGKLGDFTWLVFAPFIAAALLAWVVPRGKQNERLVGLLAFACIGLWFALAKTVPAVHSLTVQAWEAVIGWRGTLRMDASDLLTLPALLLGWWVWQRAGNTPLNLRPLAWAALGLDVVATLASDAALYTIVDSGIVKICYENGRLITAIQDSPIIMSKDPLPNPDNMDSRENFEITSQYIVYSSNDGGLTWGSNRVSQLDTFEDNCSTDKFAIDPNNSQIQYRWEAGERVERSTDGGATWILDRELVEMQQDVRGYYNHYGDGDNYGGYIRSFYIGPVSGIVDRKTGNLVLAMSWDGVLVRTSEGLWKWVSVGQGYGLANLIDFRHFTSILFFELWLAGALAFLVVTTSTTYMRQYTRRWGTIVLLCAGWGSWFILNLMLPESKGRGGSMEFPWGQIAIISLPLLVFLALPLSIGAVWDIARNFLSVWRKIAGAAVGVGLLFLLPFIPWTQGTIPRYTTALAFALLLALCGVISAAVYLRRVLPVLPSPAPKPPAETNP
ncbi:MAG: hypothetical protein R3E39_31460 [Anaerolineae bacterium]